MSERDSERGHAAGQLADKPGAVGSAPLAERGGPDASETASVGEPPGIDLDALRVLVDASPGRPLFELGLAAGVTSAPTAAAERALAALLVADAPVEAAERVRGELDAAAPLTRDQQFLAIAADLIAGRVLGAAQRSAALGVDPNAARALDRFLIHVWGVGHAPTPPGFDREHAIVDVYKQTRGPRGGYGLGWLRKLQSQALLTWRVVRAHDRTPWGSAVVVDGGWFSEALAGRQLVATCAHVCSDLPAGPGEPERLAPGDAGVDWLGDTDPPWKTATGEPWCGPDGEPGLARVEDIVWRSPSVELDAALLLVSGMPANAIAPARPPRAEIRPNDRIYIFGYPGGGAVTVSFEDNLVLGEENQYFFYHAYSEPGSSGAPVFYSKTHELVGLHRAERLSDNRRHAVSFELVLSKAKHDLAKT